MRTSELWGRHHAACNQSSLNALMLALPFWWRLMQRFNPDPNPNPNPDPDPDPNTNPNPDPNTNPNPNPNPNPNQALLSRGAAAELLADEAAGAQEEAGLPPGQQGLGRQGLGRQEHELLMLGFFSDPEGEDEEALEDFVAAAKALRRDRPDVG